MAVVMSALEVNTLIYHYFLETGLHTAAFALRAEAKLPSSSAIAPGTLLAFLEKALLFTQIETHLFTAPQHPSQRCVSDVTLLGKHICQFEPFTPQTPAAADRNGSTALTGHTSEINSVSWSPYCQVILTAAQDGSARLWKAENRLKESKAIAILPHISKTGSPSKSVKALSWTPHGTAVTLSDDGVGRMWDLKGTLTQVLMEQPGIHLGKWNKSGSTLVTVGSDNSAALWSPTGTLIRQCSVLDSAVTTLDWLNDSEFLLGTVSGSIFVQSLSQAHPVLLSSQSGAVRILVCHPGGDFVAAAFEQNVYVWTLTGALVMQQNVVASTLAWNPKFSVLTIGLPSGGIFSLDANSRTTVDTCEKHSGPVTVLAYRTEGDLFASASTDNRLLVWNLHDGRLLAEYATEAQVTDVCWNCEGTRLAFAAGSSLLVQDFTYRL